MTFSGLRFFLASDVFIACFLPLLILFATYKHLPAFSLADIRDILVPGSSKRRHRGHFTLQRAYYAFSQYARLSANELSRMRTSYGSLSRSGKQIGYKIGYPRKLDRLHTVTSLNATVADRIVELAEDEFPSLKEEPTIHTGPADLGRVRESLKHFVRDWSEEGTTERARIFAPILDFLKEVDSRSRADSKVLVPGCGLGRLAWEISQLGTPVTYLFSISCYSAPSLGYDTTANELSFFMTLPLRFLLSQKTTTTVNEHNIRPYAHWFSHQYSNDSLFRSISFPDVVPRLSANFRLAEKDFLELKAPMGKTGAGANLDGTNTTKQLTAGYDYIVTLFFIDTSLDVFATMTHIYSLLRPGGTWINLGPLLWTGGAQSKIELSLEEVLHAAEEIGFNVQAAGNGPASRKTIECEYTGDKNAMMRWIYKAEFWVATKRE